MCTVPIPWGVAAYNSQKNFLWSSSSLELKKIPPGVVIGENLGRWSLPSSCSEHPVTQATDVSSLLYRPLRCLRHFGFIQPKLDGYFFWVFVLLDVQLVAPPSLWLLKLLTWDPQFPLCWSPPSCPAGHRVMRLYFLNSPQTWPWVTLHHHPSAGPCRQSEVIAAAIFHMVILLWIC